MPVLLSTGNNNEYYNNNRYPTISCAVHTSMFPSFVHILSHDITLLVSEVVFLLHHVMAQPPPVQRPLQVRAQEVQANVQAVPQAPLSVSPAPS